MIRLIVILWVLTQSAASCHAATILETGTPGPTGNLGGTSVQPYQWLGARFSVEELTQITSVGANISAYGGEVFAAIVSLEGFSSFPFDGTSNDPSDGFTDSDVVAHTLFQLDSFETEHVSLPLPVTIEPGIYGLVFGSGKFGATGRGAMPRNNPVNHELLSYFAWWARTSGRWSWNNVTSEFPDGLTQRYVVQGFAVPEPGAIGQLGVLALVVAFVCRKPLAGKHLRGIVDHDDILS